MSASSDFYCYQLIFNFRPADLDGDGVITEKEFDTTYKEAEGVDRVYQNDKRIIDTDGNGQISRVELMVSESRAIER
jgi:hypothetical protein